MSNPENHERPTPIDPNTSGPAHAAPMDPQVDDGSTNTTSTGSGPAHAAPLPESTTSNYDTSNYDTTGTSTYDTTGGTTSSLGQNDAPTPPLATSPASGPTETSPVAPAPAPMPAATTPAATAPVSSAPATTTTSPASTPDASPATGDYAAVPVSNGRTVRENVLDREKAEFGGFKFGSAFFGWLCAMGLTTILTAIVTGTGLALGLGDAASQDAADGTTGAVSTQIGIGGIVAVLVILFISYLAGGYVAGRMARFSGVKQGLAVWIWAVVVAIILGIVAAIAGNEFNILGNMNLFPRIPINEGTLTTVGIIVLVAAILVPLLGAILGGRLGMRFHRRVDRAGLGR
jgi:hypothetical protein